MVGSRVPQFYVNEFSVWDDTLLRGVDTEKELSSEGDTTLCGWYFPFLTDQTCTPTCAPAETVPPSWCQWGRARQGGGGLANWKQTRGEVMFGFHKLLICSQVFFFLFSLTRYGSLTEKMFFVVNHIGALRSTDYSCDRASMVCCLGDQRRGITTKSDE